MRGRTNLAGGGMTLNANVESYKVASGYNVVAGDFVDKFSDIKGGFALDYSNSDKHIHKLTDNRLIIFEGTTAKIIENNDMSYSNVLQDISTIVRVDDVIELENDNFILIQYNNSTYGRQINFCNFYFDVVTNAYYTKSWEQFFKFFELPEDFSYGGDGGILSETSGKVIKNKNNNYELLFCESQKYYNTNNFYYYINELIGIVEFNIIGTNYTNYSLNIVEKYICTITDKKFSKVTSEYSSTIYSCFSFDGYYLVHFETENCGTRNFVLLKNGVAIGGLNTVTTDYDTYEHYQKVYQGNQYITFLYKSSDDIVCKTLFVDIKDSSFNLIWYQEKTLISNFLYATSIFFIPVLQNSEINRIIALYVTSQKDLHYSNAKFYFQLLDFNYATRDILNYEPLKYITSIYKGSPKYDYKLGILKNNDSWFTLVCPIKLDYRTYYDEGILDIGLDDTLIKSMLDQSIYVKPITSLPYIDGVAKQSGSAGQTIEVYVPTV